MAIINPPITYLSQLAIDNTYFRRCRDSTRHKFIGHVTKLFPDLVMHLLQSSTVINVFNDMDLRNYEKVLQTLVQLYSYFISQVFYDSV